MINAERVSLGMARRRTTKRRAPTRRAKTFNVANALEAGLIANAVTNGFFNCGLGDFVFSKDGGGASTTIAGRSTITARELIAGITGGAGGFGTSGTSKLYKVGGGTVDMAYGQSFGLQVRENLSENGGQMVASLILIPAGFKVFNTLTKKPRSMANRALKMTGLPLKV